MSENWSSWCYSKLVNDSFITDMVPAGDILGAGASEGRRERKPFIMIRVNTESPALEGGDVAHASTTNVEIWIHDNPGSYTRINELLVHLRDSWQGTAPSASGGIACRWQGNSGQLSDEGYGTITRYVSFAMIGAIQ